MRLSSVCLLLAATLWKLTQAQTAGGCQGVYTLTAGATTPVTHQDTWTTDAGTVILPNTNLGDNDPLNLTSFRGTALVYTAAQQQYVNTTTAQACSDSAAQETDVNHLTGPAADNGPSPALIANLSTSTWYTGANLWNWCGNSSGCCGLRTGCNATDLQIGNVKPFQSCWRKFQLNLTSSTTNSTPAVYYSPTDVQAWLPGYVGGAFTSGVFVRDQGSIRAASPPAPVLGYTMLQDQDYDGNDIPGCPGTMKAGYCNLPGDPQSLAKACNSSSACTGFVYQPGNSDPDPTKVFKSSGWLKTNGPLKGDCTSISTFTTTYRRSVLPQPSSNTAAIVGGVVGGVVGLALIAAAAAAFLLVRKRRQRRAKIGPHRLPTQSTGVPEMGSSANPMLPFDSCRSTDDLECQLSGGRSSTPYSSSASGPDSRRQGALTPGKGSGPAGSSSKGGSTQFSGPSFDFESGQPDAGTLTLAKMKVKGKAYPEQLWGIRPDEIQILKKADGSDWVLGSGAFGAVYKATMNGVDTVAVKVLKGKQDERTARAFVKEMSILKSCLHPQILQYMGSCTVEGHTLLITEFLDGGDLWSALARDDTYTWYNRGRIVALDLAKALAYLHSRDPKVVHQDVKSSNLLITADGRAKLADVGLARMLANTNSTMTKNKSAIGTWAWAAPEKIMGELADERADCYSFGVLLHEICSQDMPERGRLRPISVPDEAPQVVVDLMWRCMNTHPDDRPSARQCVEVLAAAQ